MTATNGIGLIVIGVVMALIGYKFHFSIDYSKWVKVNGTVIDTYIDRSVKYSTTYSKKSTSRSRTVSYNPQIKYRYHYNGTAFTSREISNVEPSYRFKYFANSFLDSYKPGTTVDVFVNPDRPFQAYLYFSNGLWWVLLVMAALLVAGGLYSVYVSL